MKRRERNRAFARIKRAAHFRATETTSEEDANTLCAVLHRALRAHLEHATVVRALLELLGDALSDQLRVEVSVLDFDDLDDDLAAREGLQVLRQGFDTRATRTDNHAGARALEDDGELIARTLDEDVAHGRERRRAIEALVDVLTDLVVLNEERSEERLWCEPARAVSFGDTDAETEWMDLLSHSESPRLRPRAPQLQCGCGWFASRSGERDRGPLVGNGRGSDPRRRATRSR